MELLTPWHLVLVIVAFMLIFGYKRLPDASRSLGRSLRIFRSEMRALDDAPPAGPTAEELEAEARAAEVRAAELRARARDHAAGKDTGNP